MDPYSYPPTVAPYRFYGEFLPQIIAISCGSTLNQCYQRLIIAYRSFRLQQLIFFAEQPYIHTTRGVNMKLLSLFEF